MVFSPWANWSPPIKSSKRSNSIFKSIIDFNPNLIPNAPWDHILNNSVCPVLLQLTSSQSAAWRIDAYAVENCLTSTTLRLILQFIIPVRFAIREINGIFLPTYTKLVIFYLSFQAVVESTVKTASGSAILTTCAWEFGSTMTCCDVIWSAGNISSSTTVNGSIRLSLIQHQHPILQAATQLQIQVA